MRHIAGGKDEEGEDMIPRIGADCSTDIRVDRDELREAHVWDAAKQNAAAMAPFMLDNDNNFTTADREKIITQLSTELARATIAALERSQ